LTTDNEGDFQPPMGLPERVTVVQHLADKPNGFVKYYYPPLGQWFAIGTSGCLVNVSEPFATEAEADAYAAGERNRMASKRAERDARRARS